MYTNFLDKKNGYDYVPMENNNVFIYYLRAIHMSLKDTEKGPISEHNIC